MPSYQADAVTSFLTNHPPPFTAAQFNNSGTVRGFPDLSANGYTHLFLSEPGLCLQRTLINDARLAAGKGPVGFINPFGAYCATLVRTGTLDLSDTKDLLSGLCVGLSTTLFRGGNQGCGTHVSFPFDSKG